MFGEDKSFNVFFGVGVAIIVVCLLAAYFIPVNPQPKADNNGFLNYAGYAELGDYKHLEVSVTKEEVTQEEIDETLSSFKANYSTYKEDENGSVDEGDFVSIDRL